MADKGDQMDSPQEKRTYNIRNSEKCFRYKDEAITNHAPQKKGIYELVTFDEKQNPQVLYVGAAFDKTIYECLEGHFRGTLNPTVPDLLNKHPNLYFDYLEEMGNAKTQEDAQDIFWWLVQKHKPSYNDVAAVRPSNRPGTIDVVELD